jgi:hypothetical protein
MGSGRPAGQEPRHPHTEMRSEPPDRRLSNTLALVTASPAPPLASATDRRLRVPDDLVDDRRRQVGPLNDHARLDAHINAVLAR